MAEIGAGTTAIFWAENKTACKHLYNSKHTNNQEKISYFFRHIGKYTMELLCICPFGGISY
jgi:hypothetical protein